MSWLQWHEMSERLATQAQLALRTDLRAAQALYAQAAEAEQRALREVAADRPRTLGITAVSAAALWYKAGQYHFAEQVADTMLDNPNLPEFANTALRDIVQVIRNASPKRSAGA